jgi:alkanesulfonate monooxygenase SsuD/methylene tetrahydromethanopterin reductase-like flavin-dependent oxidoreductase (luciferase family)
VPDNVVKLGITLPSFREDPERALAIAAAAEVAGLDGVFLYDHLFRRAADGTRRPALELLSMMGAVAAETRRIAIGSLVARATLRPPAVLASGLDTVLRIAGPGRVIAALGAGDGKSEEEMVSFGLEFGDVPYRVSALRDAVDATRDRGYPVWVGGHDPAVREVAAAHADGWNKWGSGVHSFRAQAEGLRIAAARDPFTITWGGLVVLGATEAEAATKAARLSPSKGTIVGGPPRVADGLREYADAGAEWIIVGPVDSADVENASMLGELVAPLLS